VLAALVGAATSGSTAQNIAAGPRIRIERPRIGLGGRRAVIPLPNGSQARGNRLAARVATSRATASAGPARAIGPVARAWATEAAAQVSETGRAEAEPIASAVETSRAAGVGTGTPLEEVPAGITDPALAAAAAAVPPVWDPEAEASVAVAAVAGGAGRGLYCGTPRSFE
jgi:hypothetical protein